MDDAGLEQARYEPEAEQSYRSPFPWKPILLVVSAIAIGVGVYQFNRVQDAGALRSEIDTRHEEELVPAQQKLAAFQRKVVERLLSASTGAANRFVDASLRIETLRESKVAYVRLRASVLRDHATIEEAIREPSRDAIPSCLGVPAMSVDKSFDPILGMDEGWLTDVRESVDVPRLEVRKDQLGRMIESAVPAMVHRASARYLLAAVVQGVDRTKDPTDIFVWDLHDDKLLLRTRTESTGELIGVRNRLGENGERFKGADGDVLGATDCSIAAQVRRFVAD